MPLFTSSKRGAAPRSADDAARSSSSRRLIRVALIGLHDADAMVGELGVRAREFQARHMTAYAIPRLARAAGLVARRAFAVVPGRIGQRGMRLVAVGAPEIGTLA